MSKKARLKDIAELAGVSETSVSLVLNNVPNKISKNKKNEIKKIAEQLNYRPNMLARSLKSKKTNTIALIIPDIENPFFSNLSKKLEDTASKYGYLLFIGNSDERVENDKKLLSKFSDYQVDGIIYCPSTESYDLSKEERIRLLNKSAPIILIDRDFEDIDTYSVGIDDIYGGYIATNYLLDKGCKKIACFTGNLKTINARNRVLGYKKALIENNIELDNKLLFEGNYKYNDGVEFANYILNNSIDIDGIFSCNDLMAYGFINIYNKIVGNKELSIIGYDSLQMSDMFGVKLPSVKQDITELAELTLEKLHNILEYSEKFDKIQIKPVIEIK